MRLDEKGTTYTCPLCRNQFAGADCHSSCGMSAGCNMIRCPRCSYEFVEEGTIANMLRKVFGLKTPGEDSSAS